MSKLARDYLAALFARVPRFGDVAPNNNPDRVRFDLCKDGEWVRVEDVETLIDGLEDLEADEAPKTCATCRFYGDVCYHGIGIPLAGADTWGCTLHEAPK